MPNRGVKLAYCVGAHLVAVVLAAAPVEAASSCVAMPITHRAAASPPPSLQDSLTIASLNMAGQARIGDVVADWVRERGADVLLLQEVGDGSADGSAFAVEGLLRRGYPHPRNFGTFPRVLGVYARDRGLLRLEDAIRKMTSLNAAKIGLFDRGLVRAGLFADLTIFDPARVRDRSTYEDPFQYTEGIEHVLVNGQLVMEAGRPTPARPGRALRRR